MNKKEEIIEVSIKLFSELGYEGTSLVKIAEAAGIKKPSLYAHFENKEEIFLKAMQKTLNEHYEFIQAALNKHPSSLEQKLYYLLSEYFKIIIEQERITQFYNRFLMFPPTELESEIIQLNTEGRDNLRRLLQQVIEEGKNKSEIDKNLSTESILTTYICILDGLYSDARLHNITVEESDSHISEIWEIFWRGIKNL